ncbi:hypothetical protein IJ670_06150 [bacterium]|nr:hypothetical protein [bacterium]
MKKRDLLKTGLLALGVTALSGCNSKDFVADTTENIEPKQTSVYKISTVLPYDFNIIDQIADFNKKFKKSQIVTLYNNIPLPFSLKLNGWIQIDRGRNSHIQSFEDFGKYAKYAMSKGFNIRYLFNSPKPYNDKDLATFKSYALDLLDYLKSIGINEIKIGNVQTAALINENRPGFDLTASTAMEFHTISQYRNLMDSFPNIRLIDVSVDENHNFPFLRNLKKMLPNVDIELVLNDICNKGCPGKISHHGSTEFCVFNCWKIKDSDPAKYCFKTGVVYPWFFEYYSAIGVNNFKLMPTKDPMTRGNYVNLTPMENYLTCVENGIDAYKVKDFFEDLLYYDGKVPDDYKMSQIVPYLPNVHHFIKHGDKCASRCGSDCKYCDNLAKKFETFIKTLNS